MLDSFSDYVAVALLGALVGGAELVSRYRDAPARALYNVPAAVYIFLNVAASGIALAIIHLSGWKFGITRGGAGRAASRSANSWPASITPKPPKAFLRIVWRSCKTSPMKSR